MADEIKSLEGPNNAQAVWGPSKQDLVQQATSKVAQAVDRFQMGEDADYAVGLSMLPQEGGQVVPVLVVTVAIPALVNIGERAHATSIVPNLWAGQQEMDNLVKEMLEAIRVNRSQMLKEASLAKK